MPTSFDNSVGPQVRERDRAHRLRFGVLFGLLLVASAQTATQLCARDFGYQAVLGPSLGRLYPPWAIAVWASRWGAPYPGAFHAAGNAGLLVASVGAMALVAFKLALARANPYLHGSARWASADDIRRSGLLGARKALLARWTRPRAAEGVYVGSWRDRRGRQHYLRHAGPEHVLCYAPTRAGKGVGLVVPTLLSWPHSAFVTDLKGELWSLTAGWRRAGERIVKQNFLQWLLLWLSTLWLAVAAREAGVRLNTSASVPRGFYRMSWEPPKRGDYVAVCPPQDGIFELARNRGYVGRGRCPGGYSALIKVFAAGPGEHVRIDETGVRVGERFWPSSAPMKFDSAGRPLLVPAYDRTLDSRSVLLMSQDCPSGFDGRYFGVLSHSDIVGTAIPLLTW